MKYGKVKSIMLYLFSLFMSYNFLFYNKTKMIYKGILVVLLSFVLFLIFSFILKKLNKVTLISSNKIKIEEFIVYTLIIFIVLFIDYLGNYPFYKFSDTISCIEQVINSNYNDWHPFFYTFLMIKIPYMFYQHIASCIVAQYIVILVILLYFCYFTRKYFLNFKWTIILLTFIVLNPNFLITSVFITKDIPFTYFMMLGTMFLIEIYLSNGKWLDKKRNKFFFIIMCICISNFRHNGIANYLLMMLLLIIFYKNYRKFLVSFLAIYIVTSSIIFGPVYKKLGIGQHISPHGEMLGIPLNQFAYLYNLNVHLTKKQLKMMDTLKPISKWEKYTIFNGFNEIKWASPKPYNYSYAEKHYLEFLQMYAELFLKYPFESMKNYLDVTNTIWECSLKTNKLHSLEWLFYNTKNISLNKSINKVLGYYYTYLNNPILNVVVLTVGKGLCLAIFSLFIISTRYKGDKRKYIPYILLISNALIIMCLITGGEIRFVLPSLFCFYPLILFSLSNIKTKKI